MHQVDGRVVKDLFAGTAHLQTMADIGRRLLALNRLQVIAGGNTLRKLAQVVARQQRAQFGLPDQHDLQQFFPGGFQIGEQAHLFQGVGGKILRLVDDQHGAPAARVGFKQMRVEHVGKQLDAGGIARVVNAQLVAQAGEEFHGGDTRVEDQGHVDVLGHLLQQAAADSCLAGAHLAGELHETAALAHPVQQVRQRLAMLLTHIEKTRVGRDGKRAFCESEILFVHKAACGHRACVRLIMPFLRAAVPCRHHGMAARLARTGHPARRHGRRESRHPGPLTEKPVIDRISMSYGNIDPEKRCGTVGISYTLPSDSTPGIPAVSGIHCKFKALQKMARRLLD